MKINWIELTGYIHLRLANIKKIKITPTSRKQLILGTNGCGKSSLIAEMSPLPANKSNYSKGGSKTICISHNGDEYVLKSSFENGQRHSILKNGDEELNPGGTISIQKDLVLKIFGIDQEVHDLVTGVTEFSAMSPARRREWLTRLCDENYDYALEAYGKFNERSRDITGALKLAKKKLVNETAKLLDDTRLNEFTQSIKDLEEGIDKLYELRSENSNTSQDIQSYLQRYLQEMEAISREINSSAKTLKDISFLSPDEIIDEINYLKNEATACQTKIAVLTKEYAELITEFDKYKKNGSVSLQDLKTRLSVALKQRQDQLSKINPTLVLPNAKIAYEALNSVFDFLETIFSNISENSDKRFSQAALQRYLKEKESLDERIHNSQKHLDKLHHKREHFESIKKSDKTVCPKCNNSWHIGFDENSYDSTVSSIEKGQEHIAALKKAVEELNEVIKNNQDYRDYIRDYTRITISNPSLNVLWKYFDDEELLYNYPKKCLAIITKLKTELSVLSIVEDIDDEIKKINDHIEIASKACDVDIGKVTTRLDTISDQLGQLVKEQHILNQRVTNNKQIHLKLTKLLELDSKLRKMMEKYETGIIELMRVTRNDILTDNIRKLQNELAQKQHYVNSVNIQKGIIADSQSTVDRLTSEEEVYKLLVNVLSPTDGLIAEGLLGFIRNYIKKVNNVIKRVWTYRLEIQDCSVESDAVAELDYKFPVLVQSEEAVSPDISKCSTGQQDIVNLAFKIVAMNYLGLENYPIFLDEPSAAMDAAHKRAVVGLINYLADHFSFSQFYIISHDYSQYAAMSNSQICVLCSDNIIVPSVNNEHVIIE